MTAVIEASNLVKKYDELIAVNGIDVKIEKGECFGFLGPNGAGKTTAMRMIQSISPVTSGTLKVLGMDVSKDQKQIKRRIGVAPQEDNLDPDFSVVQNLVMYARYFGISTANGKKKAEELLKFMQLEEKADVKIEQLSGGMKRRLIMARALVNDPDVLILDEPTTGLDPQARHLIWEKIRELKRNGVTVILSTHYMDEAEQLCDRLVIMELGKILIEGSPKQLIKEVVGNCVMEVIEPEAGTRVESYLKEKGMHIERSADRIYAYAQDCQLAQKKFASDFPSTYSVVRTATLEDVFLKLTGRRIRE